jgi:small-conductance mechanosensitive channel
VFNYSAEFPFLWDEIAIGVKYGSDYPLTRSILERIGEEVVGDYARSAEVTWKAMVRKFRLEDARVIPAVTVMATDNWLQFTLRYVVDYKLRRSTKDRLFMRFLEEIDKVPGRINIASSTFEITKVPTLNVQVTQGPHESAAPGS